MAITQWQRGYYDGRNGRYLPEYPVTMYDGDNNTKAMQDYEAGYCAGCDSIELTLVPMEA